MDYRIATNQLRELRKKLDTFISKEIKTSKEWENIQGYIKLANDNSEKVLNQIKYNNQFWENVESVEFHFIMSSMLNSCEYEISAWTKENGHSKSVNFGLDSFIELLTECGLL